MTIQTSKAVFKGGWDQLQHAKLLHQEPLAGMQAQGIDWAINTPYMIIIDESAKKIIEYLADDYGDCNNLTPTGFEFDLTTIDAGTSVGDARWAADKEHLYYFAINGTVYKLDAATPGRIQGMTYDGVSLFPTGVNGNLNGGFVMSDEKKFYTVSTQGTNAYLSTFEMPTNGDLINATPISTNVNINATSQSIRAIVVKPDEKQLYVIADTNNSIDRYRLKTRGDITTNEFIDHLSVGEEDTLPRGLWIDPIHGNLIQMVGILNDFIHCYEMSLSQNKSIIDHNGEVIVDHTGEPIVYE